MFFKLLEIDKVLSSNFTKYLKKKQKYEKNYFID